MDRRPERWRSFLDLPPALAAAADGDTIVVRPGTYSGGGTGGKAISIVGQGRPRLTSALDVSGLRAGRDCAIKGLVIPVQAPLTVAGNAGRVHLEDLQLGHVAPNYGAGLTIQNSAAVSVSGCDALGEPGLRGSGSIIALSGCTFTGTTGFGFSPWYRATVRS